MHVGFLQINQEKMSKSLGNFFTIKEVLAVYNPEVLRYFMLTGHYRGTQEYDAAKLEIAKGALTRLYTAIKDFDTVALQALPQNNLTNPTVAVWLENFTTVMDDDFNTPEALAVLFNLAREINVQKDKGELVAALELAQVLALLASQLGLLYQNPVQFLQGHNPYGSTEQAGGVAAISAAEIEALIVERNSARANKNWQLSDQIRDQLKTNGIVLEDTDAGTSWRKL
jgi:cysteinyl-tRNA synthetase